MPVKTISDIKSFQEVVEANEDVLIKFEAEWCSPCKAMTPLLVDFAKNHPLTKVIAVDIEGDGIYDILVKYGVRSVPTLVRVRNGIRTKTAIGNITRAELSSFAEE